MKTNPNIIDYKLLAKAIKYFSHKGYTQIETPWRVSEDSINLTFKSSEAFKSDDKFLVGSAEQGFLELISNNIIQPSRYMSVSPCFRNEIEDYYHQQEFIKLELIDIVVNKNIFTLSNMRDCVLKFIIKHLKVKSSMITLVSTGNKGDYDFDILINGIEYGSYGYRNIGEIIYIYGTGIALPRASKILKGL